MNYFRARKKIDTNIIDLETWYSFLKSTHLERVVDNYARFFGGNVEWDLEKPITLDEIIIAINKSKFKKAPGADGITNEFFKYLPNNWILYFQLFFNKILREATVPDAWEEMIIKMLYKKGDKFLPESYRPIALINTLAKLFTSILNSRLYKWAEKNGKIPEEQAGFRENRSTSEHIFTLNALIQLKLRNEKGKLFFLFVDLKSAFPTVSHSLLWAKLSKVGVSHKLINLLINLYSKAKMVVKSSEGVSKEIEVTIGLLQGETLSPILFSIFISDIVSFLQKKEGLRGVSANHLREILMLAFADDMVFLADNFIILKRIIKGLEEYFLENELEINVRKTMAVLFQKGGFANVKKLPSLLYKGEKIEFVKGYTYLGVPFSQTGLFDKAMKLFVTKGKSDIQPSINMLNNVKTVKIDTCKKVFNSLVESTVMYACPVWSLGHFKELEKVQSSFFRKLFSLPNNTPGYDIRREFGMINLEFNIFKQVLNFIFKILKMSEDRFPRICFEKLRSLALSNNNSNAN